MKYISRISSLFENVQQAKSLLNKLQIPLDDPEYLKIRDMIKGNDGYTYWFTKFRFADKNTIDELQEVWNTIQTQKSIISQFSKPIIKIESVEEFWDEVERAKIKSSAKTVLNQFPADQKALFNIANEDDLILLNELSKSKSLSALIKKISSFKDKRSLVDAAKRLLSNQLSGTYDKLFEQVKSCGADIKYASEENDIIICQVNYTQITKLGGDTSWCIVRSESTFNSYASGRLQWVIFLIDNFGTNDRMSKIGLTTDFDYYTAHDKYDGYIHKGQLVSLLKERGIDFNSLCISKETLYQMKSWDDISVGILLDRGISKDDIINRKKIFKLKYSQRTDNEYKRDLEYFTKDEIEEYNLDERSQLDLPELRKMSKEYILKKDCLGRLFNKARMSDLFDLGFTKDEIIKHNLLSKINKPNIVDLSKYNFTKDEIIKHNLLSKINVFYANDLFEYGFTKQDCYEHNLLSMCYKPHLSQLFDLGFTKDEVIKRKLYKVTTVDNPSLSYFTKEELISNEIVTDLSNSNISIDALFSIGFTSDEIIKTESYEVKKILSFFNTQKKSDIISKLRHMWSDDWKKFDMKNEPLTKLKVMILYKMGPKDIPLVPAPKSNKEPLSRIISEGSNKESNLNISLLKCLDKLGYKIIDRDTLLGYLAIFDLPSSSKISYRPVFEKSLKFYELMKLVDKNAAGIIMDDIKEQTEKVTVESTVFGGGKSAELKQDISIFKCVKLKNDISDKYPEIWNKLYSEYRSGLLNDVRKFRSPSREGESSWSSYSIDNTIYFLNFFKITKEDFEKIPIGRYRYTNIIDIISNIFERVGYSSDIERIFKYLESIGFDFSEDEKVSLLKNIHNNSDSIEYYLYLIKHNLHKNQSYEAILNKIASFNSIKEYDAKNLKDAFKDTEYNDRLEKTLKIISDREYYDKIRYELDRNYKSTNTAKDWYSKYFKEYLRTKAEGKSWKSKYINIINEYDLKVIYVLTFADKLEDMDKLDLNLTAHYASFDDNLTHTLAKIVCGAKLNDDQKKKLYNWVDRKVDDYSKVNPNSALAMQKHMQVCYYLFDRPKFEKYLELVKNSKNNISYVTHSRKTKEDVTKLKTNRIAYLRYILIYLATKLDFDEFKRIAGSITKSKMTKAERKEAEYTLSYITPDYYSDNYNKSEHDKNKKKLEDLKKELLAESVKESRIFTWSDFISRY